MLNQAKSTAILNALLNTSNLNSGNNVTFETTPYLGLLKTMPDADGANYVEVMAVTAGSEYQRVKLTNNGAYGKQIMAASRKVKITTDGAAVTVTLGAAAPADLVYEVTATVSGVDETVEVTVDKGATSGSENATGAVEKAVFKNGKDVIYEAVNQDLVTFPECRAAAWSTAEAPVKGYGIFTASTGGTLLFWGELKSNLVIGVNTIPIFRVGELRVAIG